MPGPEIIIRLAGHIDSDERQFLGFAAAFLAARNHRILLDRGVAGDLLVLAFQADLTRVATFVFANEGSNRNYRAIDVADGHHDLSHHGGNRDKLDKILQGELDEFTEALNDEDRRRALGE